MMQKNQLILGQAMPTNFSFNSLIGFVIGSFSAMVGIGGGALSIPLMNIFSVMQHKATGTASAIGLIIAIPSTIVYLFSDMNKLSFPEWTIGMVYLPVFIVFVPLTIIGAQVGVALAHRLDGLILRRIFSIFLVISSILYLIIMSYQSLPWIGLIVAISWAFYNLVRKKIEIDTDIGLLIESLYIFPFALVAFYIIANNGLNDFNLNNPGLSLYLLLAGPMTVIPLFLYVRGVELIGLGPTGMIFYITPTLQFILGYFYYGEDFSLVKFLSFIIIWIAVIIYLKDLYEKN